MRAATIQVHDFEIPGPAAGGAGGEGGIGAVNRLGSRVVPVRSYLPEAGPDGAPWATLVWAHGGSFVHGTLDWPEADWVARRFAEAGVHVYSVDYVLATETVKAPAPANDLAAALSWVAEHVVAEHETGALVVGGASAGAHLAVLAALAQADRAAQSTTGTVRPADALVLEYPTLHRVQQHDAALAAAASNLPEQRRFRASRISDMYDFYLGDASGAAREGTDAGAVIAGELPRDRLSLLPPTVIVNADADELRASGEQFATQLREAGVTVVESVQPGTIHGYLNRPNESARADADARETITRFVTELRGIAARV